MDYKIMEVKQCVFDKNDASADNLRKEMKAKHQFLINLMSSPGSGKTTTLTKVINILKSKLKIAVLEADIDGDCDADTIQKCTGAKAIQLHTGGMCHLDAGMTKQGIEGLEDDFDLYILENVGNLVCPAEFDTGSSLNMMILSIPEGDDKPLKYPLIFQVSDIVVINKIDAISVFDFNLEEAKKRILNLNPNAKIFPISAKTGEGVEALCECILSCIKEWNK